MKIQRFEGKNPEEALRLAQMALGPDAVVLQTRRIQDAGKWGIGRRPRVEVLVAVDACPGAPGAAASSARRSVLGSDRTGQAGSDRAEHQGSRASGGGSSTSLRAGAPSTEHRPVPAPPSSWHDEMAQLRREMASLRHELGQSERTQPAREPAAAISPAPRAGARSAERPAAAGAAIDRSKERETPRNGEALPPPEEIVRRMQASLVTRTIELHQGECTTVCLVGPTGVGKTTTLAKLAAVATRVEDRRVAFITVDTFRVGAVEQLETYARLLEVPMTVAYTTAEVQAARAAYAEYDLVLVDTVGRSALNAPQIEDQAALLELAHPDEVHLVLSANGSYAFHESVLRGFRALHPTHLLLSKLDEAPRLDDVLAAALGGGLPLSYVATGQRVPEDLAPADSAQLAGWLLGGQ